MDKAKLEKIILDEIEKTKKSITDLKAATRPISPDNAIGRLSRMEAINEKSVNESALRNAENHLKGLNKALNELPNEDFGECLECGEDIKFQRLCSVPYSVVCMECLSND